MRFLREPLIDFGNLRSAGVIELMIAIWREISLSSIPLATADGSTLPGNGIFSSKPDRPPIFAPNHEVAELLEVRLGDLLNDGNVESRVLDTSYMKRLEVPCFIFNNKVVWGATAMILSEIKELIKGNMA